jgi:cysteine desulfurase
MDHNATTPLDPRVLDAMLPYLREVYGNAASRTHALGHAAERAVELAREQLSELLGADPKEIIWTSGATEANNLAIKGAAFAQRSRGRHIVTQATEHPAVLDPCRWLATEGFDVTVLPVDAAGRVEVASVAAAIRPDTVLVSVMWANNETGTLQPVREIGEVCRARSVLCHCDATQAVGRVPVDVRSCAVDLLSLSAHKFYGPKGCGALYVRHRSPRTKLVPLFHGGGHERGLRSGTANVPGIVGLGAAADICRRELVADAARVAALRDRLEQRIINTVPGVTVNGARCSRLPNTTHLTFDGVEAEAMLVALGGVALSTGSACTSASMEPSHVLAAMGLGEASIFGSLRFGLGRGNTEVEVDAVAAQVADAVGRLRALRQLG